MKREVITEQTAKPYKLLHFAASFAMFFFCVLALLGWMAPIQWLAVSCTALFLVAFAARMVATTLIWWNHG